MVVARRRRWCCEEAGCEGRDPRRRPGGLDPDPLARGKHGPDRRRAEPRCRRDIAEARVTSIDLLVVSHRHHADHYGGMAEVVKAFRPRVFLASNSSRTTSTYLKLLEAVRDSGVRAIQPGESPRKIGLGSLVLTLFPQPPEDKQDENDNSIGIRLDYGDFSALLTGDRPGSALRAELGEVEPFAALASTTILKLARTTRGAVTGTDASAARPPRGPRWPSPVLKRGERLRPPCTPRPCPWSKPEGPLAAGPTPDGIDLHRHHDSKDLGRHHGERERAAGGRRRARRGRARHWPRRAPRPDLRRMHGEGEAARRRKASRWPSRASTPTRRPKTSRMDLPASA